MALCCSALSVRREGYYAWQRRPKRAQRDEALVSALKQAREKHTGYGVQSLLDQLPEAQKVSYGKGYRVCRENGLLLRRRKPHGITRADPAAQSADDLVRRDFTACEPNTKWLTDITQIACKDGKLYLCGVLDCFDAGLVGFSMDTHMKTELCTAALTSAVKRFGKTQGLIVHSDRGSQFTSHLYRETLAHQGFRQSMGRTGSCFDNARMESFFATLKKELIYRMPLYKMTREEVRSRIFQWLAYYNQRRRHTSNDAKRPPLVKRELWNRQSAAA